MSYRALVLARTALRAVVLLVIGACATVPQRPAGRFWLVLVDASCSIDSVAGHAYTLAWRRLVDAAAPGDRIALLPVRAGVYAATVPRVDVVLPGVPGLFDSRVQRRHEIEALRTRLREVSLTGAVACSQTTPLLEAMAAAGRLLDHDPRERRVVIMSDMAEDSEGIVFKVRLPSPDDVTRHLERWEDGAPRRAWRRTAVDVVSVGHVAPPVARAVQTFWTAYFRALGADLRSYDGTLSID